jgi:hypothetical protein
LRSRRCIAGRTLTRASRRLQKNNAAAAPLALSRNQAGEGSSERVLKQESFCVTRSGGGAILNNFYCTATVKNSIIGNSHGPGGDCYNSFSTLTALGANLNTNGSCGTNFSQVTSAQLNLAPLALNAPGSTKTLALLPGSVAIDSAPDCTDVSGSPVTTDQRGVARPDGLGEAACDIGAFEFADETLFASFTAKLSLDPSDGAFDLNSRFTLGATTNGIDPFVEPVSLAIGSYSVTFAPGSFKKNKKGAYVFDGAIHGVELNVRISPLGGNSYRFQASGEGAKLKGIKNPVTVTLTIGADLGSVVVHAKFDD